MQIEQYTTGDNLFFILSDKNIIDLIISEAPYCTAFVYNNFYNEVFGSFWEKLNEENKNAIKSFKDIILKENVLKYIEDTVSSVAEQDINVFFDSLIKRISHTEKVIGFR